MLIVDVFFLQRPEAVPQIKDHGHDDSDAQDDQKRSRNTMAIPTITTTAMINAAVPWTATSRVVGDSGSTAPLPLFY